MGKASNHSSLFAHDDSRLWVARESTSKADRSAAPFSTLWCSSTAFRFGTGSGGGKPGPWLRLNFSSLTNSSIPNAAVR